MSDIIKTSDTITELRFGEKHYVIIGTAHVSQDSAREVANVISEFKPGRVCIELDESRYHSMTQKDSWKNLDIYKVIRQGKGFFLLANLVMASFQKRMGLDSGSKPGEEMREAIRVCEELKIPFSLIDRDIQVTFRRAWGKSGFWGKNKLIATLLSSAFTTEKMTPEQVEELKKKSALQGMMEEFANYLPAIKNVLIDERDQHLACKMYEQTEGEIVAVVGAGHVPGIVSWLSNLHSGTAKGDISEIVAVPPPSKVGKVAIWAIPVVLVGLITWAFVHAGWHEGLTRLLEWWLIHGTLVALGAILALAHPLTIVLGFLISPLGTFHIVGSVGILTGGIEAVLRRPRVNDLENLQDDITTLRGFYRNRVTRILLVFLLPSIGGLIGNLISIPAIFAR